MDLQNDMEELTPEQRLRKYLEERMTRDYTPEIQGLQTAQNEALGRQGELGMLEAATEIGQAGIGASNVGVNLKGSREAAQARLNDYLTQKKAERNAQYDQMSAAKELADMEAAKRRAEADAKREARMEKYQQGMLGIGQERLDLAKKKHDLDLNKFGWTQDMKDVSRANKIGQALTEIGEPEFESAANRVESKLEQFGMDIPGKGRFGSLVPNWINTPEAQQFKSDIQALLTPVRKGYYGSALTATELKNFEEMTGTGKGYSEAAFRHAINTLINDKRRAINSVKARDPIGYSTFENQRQGMFIKQEPQTTGQQPSLDQRRKALEEKKARLKELESQAPAK